MSKKPRLTERINNLVAKHATSSGAGAHTDKRQQTRAVRGQKHPCNLARDASRHEHQIAA